MKIALFVTIVVLQLVTFALACGPSYPPEPHVVIFPPYADAGTVDAELEVPADCRVACESLARVGCPESAPKGRTCGSVCAAAVKEGIKLPLICIAASSTPDQIRACGKVRCEGR